MTILALLAAILFQASGTPSEAPTLDQVRTWTAPQAAERLIPAPMLSSVVGGWFRAGGPPGNYTGYWWGAAEPVGEGLCRRSSYQARLSPIMVQSATTAMQVTLETVAQFAPTYPREATRDICDAQTGWIGTRPEDETIKRDALVRLAEAMRLAAADEPLPFELSCESTSPRPCPGARAALASLPLSALYDARPMTDRYREEPVVNGVRSRYALPPSQGVYPSVEIAMGPDQDRDSWFVTLHGRERVERVTIRRAMVIYH
ncbi:hypothetical protein [Brevundimonas sp.]|uniref:hypothetical protein n=1 Tax=Brevundimonas sp. TaxID=1871086 RepID=UPI003D11F6D5